MTNRFLTHENLSKLVADLVAANTRVIAPVPAHNDPQKIDYATIQKLEDASFGTQLPRRSAKEFFLPTTEVLLRYRDGKNGFEVEEVPTTAKPQVLLGASPCDVAAMEIVDKVMNWDYRDELWFGRREATTIVSLLCSKMDDTCFCTAVGLGPDAVRGSDAMLMPIDGGYFVRVVTEKGEALFKNYGTAQLSDAMYAQARKSGEEAHKKVETNMPAIPADFAAALARNFDHPLWKTMALRCHGCGACASVCPTCHCFDIVDEHDDAQHGVRRRNWDSCQTQRFTVHGSGHNPRASQTERFRQRVEHKFSIYPSRFGEILCTGCGRCSRTCPGGMNLAEVVGEFRTLAVSAQEGSAQ
ncbi:MAG TPA: 4Fe-4S dicluster domain-containing protein [candidate division Zixibacteria bacterium]|nr:4Fe-4S dicluster domain-containing protein [candidate division Zixibacteria bacterium]